jgi:uncharacterized cupredoxin-like copper-binding protein
MRRTAAVLLPFAAALLLAAPAFSAPTVTVKAKEFSFALSKTSVAHGKVTFSVKNVGKVAHDFSIAGHKTAMLSPGKSAKLVVTLKSGKYPYTCTVDSHAKLGMKGTLTVT